MKPGPPRECYCGECTLCKHRKHAVNFYQRNKDAIIRKNSENRRLRKQRAKRPQRPQPADDELDRKAREWLLERRI